MRVDVYHRLMAMQASRRKFLGGAATVASVAALGSTGVLGTLSKALAQDNLRAEILKIPGVGKGSPTDADWQKVGEMCLGATKANVQRRRVQGRRAVPSWGSTTRTSTTCCSAASSSRGRPIPAPRSTGSTSPRPTTTPACSSRSPPAPSTSTSSRWARPSRATSAARACLARCPTGSRPRSTWTTMSVTSRRRSAPGTARPTASRSTATATTSTTAPTCSPSRPRRCLEGDRRRGRLGRADHLAAGPGRDQVPQGQDSSPARTAYGYPRPAARAGAASASTSSAAAPPPTPSTPTTRPGCSIRTP